MQSILQKSRIDLRKEKLSDSDVIYIIEEGIVARQCQMLWLVDNHLSAESIHRLLLAVDSSRTLEALSLCNNNLTDNDLCVLTKIMSRDDSTIVRLALTLNAITDEGVRYLSEMLQVNKSLRQLWLGFNQITDYGAQILINTLSRENKTLEILSLSWNSMITDQSIDCILSMLEQNRRMKMLALVNCHLSQNGRNILCEAAKNRGEFYFDF